MTDLRSETTLAGLGAAELARRIRARDVSSAEVVEAHIARIEEVNPRLNAVVVSLFEQARAEARSCSSVPTASGPTSWPACRRVASTRSSARPTRCRP